MSPQPRTMFQKIRDDHVVAQTEGGEMLLYIDRHLVNEVTSPQAFEGLRAAGRAVRRPEAELETGPPAVFAKGAATPVA